MSKKEAFDALDKTMANDFDEIPPTLVPMVIKETEVPEDRSKDNDVVRGNLFDVSTKLSSCFDFLVNNFEQQMNAPGLLKASPTGDIVEIAKAMVYVNKQILTLGDDKEKPKEKPKGDNNTQYNTFIGSPNEGFTAEMIDKMIKNAVKNTTTGPTNINNNKEN